MTARKKAPKRTLQPGTEAGEADFWARHSPLEFPDEIEQVEIQVKKPLKSVLAIRLRAGRPLMEGDRNHFAHRLLRLGMGQEMVLVTVALTVVATAAGATVPYGGQAWRAVVPAVQAAAIVLVIVMLEIVSARRGGVSEGP